MSSFDGQVSGHAGDGEEEFPYYPEDWDIMGWTEPLENYKSGGLHPIHLGDRLGTNGRFRVVHKLGHGGYGTVWLCQDTLSPTTKWRAVKVMSAKESTPDCAELRVMETLRTIDHSTLESDFHISSPLEHFWIDGPNGRHLALVFTLSAINTDCLFRVHGPNRTLIKDLCFQLAKSLELIHSRGLCHGDFRSSNILVRLLPGIDSLPEAELLKAFHNGKCKKPETVRVISVEDGQPVTRSSAPSVPEHLVSSVSIGFHSSLCAASLAITDFGVSYPFSDPPVQGCTGIPLAYTSPEERFHQRSLLGPASDIWALGYVILQLAFNVHPFAALNLECGDDDNTIAAKFEEIMGPMPEPYRQVYKEEHGEMAKWRCFNEAVAESDKTGEEYITAVEDWKTKQLAERRAKIKAGECQLNLGQEWFRKTLQRTNYMAITSQERDGMIQQYESSSRRRNSRMTRREERKWCNSRTTRGERTASYRIVTMKIISS